MDDHIGAFEAKTHFAQLLDRVAKGESVVITRHGAAVARLVPVRDMKDRARIRETVERLLEFSKHQTLGGIDWKELRDEGRKT
jgi:prevent-host-death family protein